MCGATQWRPGSAAPLSQLGVDFTRGMVFAHYGAAYCGECRDRHDNGVNVDMYTHLDAEITRRKSLLEKSSTGSGVSSGNRVPDQPSESARPTPKVDPYVERRKEFPFGKHHQVEYGNAKLRAERIAALQTGDALSRLAARRSRHHAEVLREIDTRRTFTDRLGVVRTWDGRRVE